MILDTHIHMYPGPCDGPETFLQKAAAGGVGGGTIFSIQPHQGLGDPDGDYRWEYRLERVLEYASRTPGFIPYFRIDPQDSTVGEQIKTAAERGIAGFKIIFERCFPSEGLDGCRAVAETGLPLMFHSGILSGGRDLLSGKFNYPIEFECMFAIRGLRFSMAHLGWPWVDDYMAMVAKAAFTHAPEFGNEMFFDLTPGTPGIYREPSLRKLYLTGYHVKKRVLWGTDGAVNDYDPGLPRYWQKKDGPIFDAIVRDVAEARLPYEEPLRDHSDILELATERNWRDFNSVYLKETFTPSSPRL